MKALRRHPEYHDYGGLKTLDLTPNYLDRNYRLIKVTDTEYETHRTYDCTGLPRGADNQNVLALGGYKKRQPYSYIKESDGIKNKFGYFNINDDWTLKFIETSYEIDPFVNIR